MIKELTLNHVFKDQINIPKPGEDIFRKQTDKTWFLPKTHQTIKTFIESTYNDINEEILQIKLSKYSNLSKVQQRGPVDLKERDDTVLKPSSSRTPGLYVQPKMYKQGNSERLVISSANCYSTANSLTNAILCIRHMLLFLKNQHNQNKTR